MALTVDDCTRMVEAADRNGVLMLVGHSQSLDIGIVRIGKRRRCSGRLVARNHANQQYERA